jgi:hypothetical protein
MRLNIVIVASLLLSEQASSLLLSSQSSAWRTSQRFTAMPRRSVLALAYFREDGETLVGLSGNSKLTADEQQTSKKDCAAGAGTLGDIMTDESQVPESGDLSKAGLVTLDGGTLASRFGIKSRLDRMALTANGNLQRLFSSYYDAPVQVVVDKCEQETHELWDRVVHLTVFDQVC